MAPTEYTLFDLQILKGKSGFTARVLESPQGGARPGGKPKDRTARDRVRQIGSQVFQAVFAGEVGRLFHASLSKADESERGLRLRLRLCDAGELSEFPWEFLFDDDRGQFTAAKGDLGALPRSPPAWRTNP